MGFFSAPSSIFEPPSLHFQLISSPLQLGLSYLHRLLIALRGPLPPPLNDKIRVVCISDTHTNTAVDIPQGDLLIHAGDLTNVGNVEELQAQVEWLDSLGFEHVVMIAGNHDSYFDPRSRRSEDQGRSLDFKGVHYLQHSTVNLTFVRKGSRELTVFGAPQIPACGGDEMAFQYPRKDDAWTGTIPSDIDILVTHTPPRWHLDLPVGAGCEYLLQEAWKARPRLHVFGHVHGGRGGETVFWDEGQKLFESICRRQGLWNLLGPRIWVDAALLVLYDLKGILWTRIWGADADVTAMINAGVVDWRGKLAFGAQVIEI